MKNPFDDLVDDAVTPRTFVRQAWAGFVLVVFLALGLAIALHFIASAQAQGVGFTQAECKWYAHFARTSAEIRDLQGKLELHLALVKRRVEGSGGMRLTALMERELRRVYTERLVPEKAEESAYTRCMSGEIVRAEG